VNLEYLKNIPGKIDFDFLTALKAEREAWFERPSADHYKQLLANLPEDETFFDGHQAEVQIGKDSSPHKAEVIQKAKDLIAWRKGPFNLMGETIDAEWRSDQKWQRIAEALGNQAGKVVADIGCNNGYFMFRLAAMNPKVVMGIDPVLHYATQFRFLNHFAGQKRLHFEMFGIEHMQAFEGVFDTILSMGIIYHHRHPIQQLLDLREALKPGGQLILETIGIPGDETYALFPEERYAKMKNVWFVPTLSCFVNWAKRARFVDVEVIADTPLTPEEQRLTDWCPPPHQSLEDFLDPQNPEQTVEGYPAPRRFALIARKRR
jgi:tRNA (mo5U34)-methyltransferase